MLRVGGTVILWSRIANRLEGEVRMYLRSACRVCSLALLDQVLLRLSTCLVGGSETNSTPLVLLRPSTCLMVSSEENSTPLVLLRLSNSPVLRGLRRELDPSCFTASQ